MEARLDYKKWRAELDAAMEKKDAGTVTKLHRIRAQIKGKLHRQRARLEWFSCSKLKKLDHEAALKLAHNGGSAVMPLTFTDENTLLGDAWKAYVKLEEPRTAVAPKQEKEAGFILAISRWLAGSK